MKTEREKILSALASWINQRPGLQFANYGDVSSYRSELRGITRDLHDARALLAAISWRESIGAEELKAAFPRAFSGRLSWQSEAKCDGCGKTFWDGGYNAPCNCEAAGIVCNRALTGNHRLDYCTGQYWPTEYRAAVCAVLVSALWDYFRKNMPKPDGKVTRNGWEQETYKGMTAGDYIRHTAKRELGARLAKRWFR